MRIGITGGGSSAERIVAQAERAEADGFTSIWYPSAVQGDPLVVIALAARATKSIELGTAILQTYTCHPVLQAARAASVALAVGEPGRFTLGVGPSHQPFVEDLLGLSYATPGRHTEEYVKILAPLLRGDMVHLVGEEWSATATAPQLPDGVRVPVLVGALAPRLLRVAGEHADGTITWMANAEAVESHIAPRIRAAAEAAGNTNPRIVVGLPVAVHENVDEARAVAAEQFSIYGMLPNYLRVLERGGIQSPEQAAIVGDEESVAEQIQALFDAGATDFWAAPFPVGDDISASRHRTRALLKKLVAS